MINLPQSRDSNGPFYRPLSITFIEYQDGDMLGFVLAWFSMLPLIYILCLCTLIAFRRDIQTICYLAGFIVSSIINHGLKVTFKQPRPERTRHRMSSLEVYGMPSAHAQSFFYFMTYIGLLLILKSQKPGTLYERAIRHRLLLSMLWTVASLVAYSRIYLYYHSVNQVLVGSFLGILFGFMWYYFINYRCMAHVTWIIDQTWAKRLLIRDYSSIPNLIRFQYESESTEARKCRERMLNYSKDQTSLVIE